MVVTPPTLPLIFPAEVRVGQVAGISFDFSREATHKAVGLFYCSHPAGSEKGSQKGMLSGRRKAGPLATLRRLVASICTTFSAHFRCSCRQATTMAKKRPEATQKHPQKSADFALALAQPGKWPKMISATV